MHVSLTDLLTCPRCGPEHGLVLVPGEVRDRRVAEGVLGCPNCRERYPIAGGVADLRAPGPEGGSAAGSAGVVGPAGRGKPAGAAGGAVRLAALLGLAEGSGVVVLTGDWSRHGPDLAALVPDVEVVVAGGAVPESGGGYTRMRVSGALPMRSGSVRGVGLQGAVVAKLLGEAERVLGASGRLVLEPAGSMERAALEALGLTVLAAEGDTVVAGRSA